MKRRLRSISALRIVIAVAMTLLAIWSGASVVQADVLAVSHVARGEHLTLDGGWSAACDPRQEACESAPGRTDSGGPMLHHHHHTGGAVNCLPATAIVAADMTTRRQDFESGAPQTLKSAAVTTADQPPKA